MNDWNIQSRAHACEACQQPFTDKQSYHTILSEEKVELRRQDVCDGCWQERFAGAQELNGFISQWQGVYQAPPPVTEAIQKGTAETILKKLIELNDPRYVPAGFILAVMLERKRVLKVKEQVIREGRRTIIYEQSKTGEVFTITDPDLHLNQLEEVQRDVAHLLEHGFNPTQAAESVTTTVTPQISDGLPESTGEPAPATSTTETAVAS